MWQYFNYNSNQCLMLCEKGFDKCHLWKKIVIPIESLKAWDFEKDPRKNKKIIYIRILLSVKYTNSVQFNRFSWEVASLVLIEDLWTAVKNEFVHTWG